MSTPDAQGPQWVFAPAPRRRIGRTVLIASLSVLAAAAIVGVIAWQMIATADNTPSPAPSASGSASPSASSTATPGITAPSPTASASPSAGATITPVTPTPSEGAPGQGEPSVEPVPAGPDAESFRADVANRLNDASTGLGLVEMLAPQDVALQITDPLTIDAQNLANTPAPTAIDEQWRDGVDSYMRELARLGEAAGSGSDLTDATASAREKLTALRALAGLD